MAACLLIAIKLRYGLKDTPSDGYRQFMNAIYVKLNGVSDFEDSLGTVTPVKGVNPSNIRPLWRISDLPSMENVRD